MAGEASQKKKYGWKCIGVLRLMKYLIEFGYIHFGDINFRVKTNCEEGGSGLAFAV